MKKKQRKPAQPEQAVRTVTNPHDLLFRQTFCDPVLVEELIQKNLPLDVVESIDFSTLRFVKDTVVIHSAETRKDLIFEVEVKGSPSYLVFLLEHKSYVDRLAIYQMLRYIAILWEHDGKVNPSAPAKAIVPVLVYHGAQKTWSPSLDTETRVKDFVNLPSQIQQGIPRFTHHLVNLMAEEDLSRYRSYPRLVLGILVLGRRDLKETVRFFVTTAEEVKGVLEEDVFRSLMGDLLDYLLSIKAVTSLEDMLKRSEEIARRGNAVMSIYEKGLQRGLQEGLQKGEVKRSAEIALEMLREGFPLETVLRLTRIDEDKLLLLKKQIQEGDTKGVTS